MKFTVAWSQVVSQNVALRASLIALSACSFVFCIATIRLSLREPLVIERECLSRAVPVTDAKHSVAEIESFIRHALTKRFDTQAVDALVFLSADEARSREKEQDELAKRSMSQQLLINSIDAKGTPVLVNADRVMSVGKIKSVLALPLEVALGSTQRTPANPYGLVIKKVTQMKEKSDETK